MGQRDTRPEQSGLRSNTLSLPMIVALGLAYMSLAPVIFFNFGFMTTSAGKAAAPIMFAIVTLAILPTAVSFAQLAKRRPSAGSASVWVTESIGPVAGMWTGWLQTSLYAFGCAIYPAYFSVFFNPFLEYFGIQVSYTTSALASVAICLVVAYLMRHDVALEAKTILIFLAIEAGFVLALSLFIIFRQAANGHLDDPLAPFSLSGAAGGTSGIVLAFVFGVLSLAGVDSVAPVAEEAQNPRRHIPRATYIVVLGAGLYWVVASYGYSIAVPFETLASYVTQGLVTPIYPIADEYIGALRILVPITGFTAVLAGFGATAICASRLLFNQARLGNAPTALARTHPRYGSPWNASKPILVFATVAPIAMGIWLGRNAGSAAAWWGGVFVYFALVTYIIANLTNFVWHRKHARHEFSWWTNGVIPLIGIGVDGYLLYKGFFDVYLSGPFDTGKSIVLFSLLWTVVGLIWATWAWRRSRTIVTPETTPAVAMTAD